MPLINCARLKNNIFEELQKLPRRKQFLAGIVAKQDNVGQSFQRIKQKAAEQLNIDYRIFDLADGADTNQAEKLVSQLAANKDCGGIVVQLPLPPNINTELVINSIPFKKDVDCLGIQSFTATKDKLPTILPPAVQTTIDILHDLNRDPFREEICVVGAGRLVGKPIATYFMAQGVERLTVVQKGDNLQPANFADILILGTGVPGLISAKNLKKNAVVIDFGYSTDEHGMLRGDFQPSESRSDIFYTPTPGGTGPLLVANLLKNFCQLTLHTN